MRNDKPFSGILHDQAAKEAARQTHYKRQAEHEARLKPLREAKGAVARTLSKLLDSLASVKDRTPDPSKDSRETAARSLVKQLPAVAAALAAVDAGDKIATCLTDEAGTEVRFLREALTRKVTKADLREVLPKLSARKLVRLWEVVSPQLRPPLPPVAEDPYFNESPVDNLHVLIALCAGDAHQLCLFTRYRDKAAAQENAERFYYGHANSAHGYDDDDKPPAADDDRPVNRGLAVNWASVQTLDTSEWKHLSAWEFLQEAVTAIDASKPTRIDWPASWWRMSAALHGLPVPTMDEIYKELAGHRAMLLCADNASVCQPPVAPASFQQMGPNAKKDKTARRNKVIKVLMDQGLDEPAIYDFLKANHLAELTYGKSRKLASLNNVMKQYRRSIKTQHDCSSTGTTAIIP